MTDKNGMQIKAGQVVQITGAYFKRDNGLWLVISAPGDVNWDGSYLALTRIGKTGKLSSAKGKAGEWPLVSYSSNREERYNAKIWNEEHAQIEVLGKTAIKSWDEVRAMFQEEVDKHKEFAIHAEFRYGWSKDEVDEISAIADHYADVVARIPA